MNSFEHLACSSSAWRYFSERHLLPWVFAGQQLGEHALEIGAGYGAGTQFLRRRVERVTALEYDVRLTMAWKAKGQSEGVEIVCGDGAQLPFGDERFSSVTAILVLHHLKSAELQKRMLSEVMRVLRRDGVFVGFEIGDSWLNRIGHIGSTFTPFTSSIAQESLSAAGFANTCIKARFGAYRFTSMKSTR
ncbi:MAG TPA: class I SAM-dependent methyltransferase [Candidatus Saccharimonadales bacterium]|nr:class I SAM-dependent methyltransferase [Candidatus Saccharimonadales bacterium]